MAKKKGGIEYEDGGIKIQRPLSLAEHSTITQLATGYEPISLSVQSVLSPAVFEWSDFCAPIVISAKESYENSGEKAVVKILEARMRSVMQMLRKELNKQILIGNSAILTSINTLNGSASATGFFEADDVGTQGNSVGGVSKATFAATTGWQNNAADLGANFGTTGIVAMQRESIRCGNVAPMGGIDLVLLSEQVMANYRRSLFQQERYINESMLDAGRMQLAFGGAVVESDLEFNGIQVASAGLDGLAPGNYDLAGYMLNFDAIKMIMHKDADFAVSPFEHISGTTARAAQLYVKCQLIADHLGSNSILVRGTTF